jgi:8-oxo-dGTP diphosphatase
MQTVTCAVIEKNGRILIARRKPDKKLGNKWEFPGGKVEHNETPEACLRRELAEEFGIEVQVGYCMCQSTFTYNQDSIILLAFEAVHVAGEFTLHDHQEIRWVLPDEFDEYDFSEADIPIVKKIIETYL